MDNTDIASLYNQTFTDLGLFYRDTTLAEELIAKYKVGQILMERGFTDMSYKGGGLATNLRYLIASAHAKDLSMFNPDGAEAGHVLLSSNAFFKVLDVYRIGNKTQIFLLNFPPVGVELFSSNTSNVEDDVVKVAREKFDTLINKPLISELQTHDWKDRTKAPVGMSDEGEFFHQSKSAPPTAKPFSGSRETNIDSLINEPDPQKPWWKFW